MLIVTIVQNFVKLPYLEVTFLETSYFSVLGLCRPIIYRPDDLFQILMQTLSSRGKPKVFLPVLGFEKCVINTYQNDSYSNKK